MIANAIAGIVAGTASPLTYSQTILQDNPVGFWLMNEASGSTAADTSGNGNNATYFNTPTLNQAGPSTALNKSVLFNGTNEYGVTSTVSTFNMAPGGNWSIEGWFKTSSAATNAIVHVGGTGGSQSDVLCLLYIDSGQVGIVTPPVSGGNINIRSTATFNNNAWHYAAVTSVSGGAVTVYVDGVSVASSTTARRANGVNSATYLANQNNLSYFNGNTTATAVYNTTLSSTRITAHYDAGK
jgi:hypothetical protein